MNKNLNFFNTLSNKKEKFVPINNNKLGMTYEQIEEAMKSSKSEYYKKYQSIRQRNLHKMKPIPICKFKDE